METISKHHFNKDLDEYMHTRRNAGKKPLFNFKIKIGGKKRKQEDSMPMEVPEHEVRNVLNKKPVQDKTILESKEEMQEQPGFFENLFGSMFGKKADYEDAGEPIETKPVVDEKKGGLDPDAVEVLKIAGKWLSRMPPEMKEEFKNSQDYAKYKFYLDKLGLTKKKE